MLHLRSPRFRTDPFVVVFELFFFFVGVCLRLQSPFGMKATRGREGGACAHAEVPSADVHGYGFSAFQASRSRSNRVLCTLWTTRSRRIDAVLLRVYQ